MLAVVHRHPYILHGIAGNCAAFQHLANAFFHGRNELIGDGASHNLVDKFETAFSRHGLYSKINLAELAGAAGLLLVAVMAFRRFGDGFAVRDARRLRVHLHIVLLRHLLEHDTQMQVARAVQDALVQ